MNLREFCAWALAQGSVANPQPDNWFKGQCVSLIQQYLYRVFNKPFKAYGNAKDWANNYPKDYFNKYSSSTALQRGDVLVYGGNYGGGYGHIALIDADGNFFDQNGVKSKAVSYRLKPFSGYVCILRPINQDALELNDDSSYKVGTTYTTQVILKVRAGAGTGYAQKSYSQLTPNAKEHSYSNGANAGCLKEGTRVTCQEIKNVGNDVWIRIPSGWIAAKYNGKVYVK